MISLTIFSLQAYYIDFLRNCDSYGVAKLDKSLLNLTPEDGQKICTSAGWVTDTILLVQEGNIGHCPGEKTTVDRDEAEVGRDFLYCLIQI